MNDKNRSMIEEMLRRDPLVAFSMYTLIQTKTLRTHANQVRKYLDQTFATPGVMGEGWNEAYGLFWLWLLGAYEVVRTMSQAQSCFVPPLATRLRSLKKRLATLRIPFAKQELAGEKRPIGGEPSIAGMDDKTKSLIFMVGNQRFSMRGLIDEFERVIDGIALDDILADHRDSTHYPPRVVKQTV